MIYIGSDHGGYKLKGKIKQFFDKYDYNYIDLGDRTFDKNDDYPDYAFAVAEKVGKEDDPSKKWAERAKGILFCRSSGGMIIAANKVKNIRAVSVFDVKSAKHSREHNDANIIALAADWIKEKETEKILKIWLKTEFSNEKRHIMRLNKIKNYEKTKNP